MTTGVEPWKCKFLLIKWRLWTNSGPWRKFGMHCRQSPRRFPHLPGTVMSWKPEKKESMRVFLNSRTGTKRNAEFETARDENWDSWRGGARLDWRVSLLWSPGANLGEYFLDSLLSDIDSLQLFAGIHPWHFGYQRLLSKRFPFAIYYRIDGDIIHVFAVLDCRQDPKKVQDRLS